MWKHMKSSVINPMMKWMNVCNEYAFGNNTIFTILSKVLIGHRSVRANLLSISHRFYHCVILINPLMSYFKEQQKQFQLQQMKLRQQQQLQQQSLNNTTAGLRKTIMRSSMKAVDTSHHNNHNNNNPAQNNNSNTTNMRASMLPPGSPDKRSSTYLASQNNTNNQTNQTAYQPPTVNPIFELYEANKEAEGNGGTGGGAAMMFQIKFQFEQFVLNNVEYLIQMALELVKLVVYQNAIRLGPLGNVSNLCIQDPFFFQVFDDEIIACMDIVTDFYSREITDVSMILTNAYYYDDGIDSCLLILKELTLIVQHRFSSVFVSMAALKTFLSAIGFYVNYFHFFSFDERDYTIYQDAAYRRQVNTALKNEARRKQEVKHIRKQLRQRTEGLRELSSTITDPANLTLAVSTRKKRNAFAVELGQFFYRVLGIMMLHHTSLNICHKGVLYLRYVMREQFLEKHIIEDLFSLPCTRWWILG